MLAHILNYKDLLKILFTIVILTFSFTIISGCGDGGSDDGNGTVVMDIDDEICNDNTDNDADGNVDCDDSECANTAACVELNCADGSDSDGDGMTDCADPDCSEDAACPEDCDNNLDDDADGMVDCSDSECASSRVCTPITPPTMPPTTPTTTPPPTPPTTPTTTPPTTTPMPPPVGSGFGSISGRIESSTGVPVNAVHVRAISISNTGIQVGVFSGMRLDMRRFTGDGFYRIDNLPVGSYRVLIERMDEDRGRAFDPISYGDIIMNERGTIEFPDEYYNGTNESGASTDNPSESVPVNVNSDEITGGINFITNDS